MQAVHRGLIVEAHQNLTIRLVQSPAGLVAEVIRPGKPDDAPRAGRDEVGLMLAVGGLQEWTKLYVSNGLRETLRFRATVVVGGQTADVQEACASAGVSAFVLWPKSRARVEVSGFSTGGRC